MRSRLLQSDDFDWALQAGVEEHRQFRLVGGLDISFFSDEGNPGDNRACVALIVCECDEKHENLTLVWKDFIFIRIFEPYIAGFLAFREARHYCEMFRRLQAARPELMPDVTLVDGNGVLHPRGFGVASHVGVLADQVTIGVAKNLHMVDGLSRDDIKVQCQATPDEFVPMVGASGRTWGAALLPKPRAPALKKGPPPKNPIFVSVGHRISLESSVAVVCDCFISARVPEPVRLADVLSREEVRKVRAQEEKDGTAPLQKQSASASHWQYVAVLCVGGGLAYLLWTRQAGRRR